MARVATLTVGGQEYTNLLCSLIPNRGSTSHLGLGFFRRHLITIDFTQSRIFLEGRSSFTREDEDDMSGLHLLRKDGAVVVFAADQGSPAALAGFLAGDELMEINGRKAALLSMRDIRQIFMSGDGNTVTAQVKSNRKVRSLNLRLKRSI
jgi:C-terminal processing protease CtpA/Prc